MCASSGCAVSEADFLEAVERVAEVLSKKIKSPLHDPDDISQLARMYAWECLPRFDPNAGSLDAYLYSAAKNRILNSLRELGRLDYPCKTCWDADQGGPGHSDGSVCEAYARWATRQAAKRAVKVPQALNIDESRESRVASQATPEGIASANEIHELLERGLSPELLGPYRQMLDGERLPARLRGQVQIAVSTILRNADIEPPECKSSRLNRRLAG